MASDSDSARSGRQGSEVIESSNERDRNDSQTGRYLPVALGRDRNIDDTIRVLRRIDWAIYGGDAMGPPRRLGRVEINNFLCSAIYQDLTSLVSRGQIRHTWVHEYGNLLVDEVYSEIGHVFDNWSVNRDVVFEGLARNDSVVGEARLGYTQLKICRVGEYASKEAEMCIICLEKLYGDNIELGLVICGHEFHEVCVSKWFKERNTCPVCRREVLAI